MTHGKKQRYGLFGHPVAQSRSPAMQAEFAQQMEVRFDYELLDVTTKHFSTAVTDFFAQGGRGCNITLPHKVAALKLATTVTERARVAGAVNTLKRETNGHLRGDNTDGAGLVRDLVYNHAVQLHGKRLLLCGAGGAARGALAPLLAEQPAALFIANRTVATAQTLVAALANNDKQADAVTAGAYAALPGQLFDVVINATSASLNDTCPPLPDGILAADATAYDLVYKDTATPFMLWAKQRGATTVLDGWGMLVEQAAESFQLWFGTRPETHFLLKNR